MSSTDNIFSGLKVLDVASFIAGPAAATILSDFGANVIKIEPPTVGDPYRYISATPPYPVSDVNYGWNLNNRNRRSIALNLKSEEAKKILCRLVEQADVFITNFPPKVKAGLGLSYEILWALNPRLIYADLTGFGAEGPEADKPGFDITAYWARSGLMDVTHDAGSPPSLPIPGIGDHGVASTLYSAIVTGLYLRERTGKGRYVTTSLLAEGAWAAGDWIEGALNGAKFYPQHDRRTPPNAMLNPYRTSDDRWLLLVAPQPKDWVNLVNAMGLSKLLEDPRFADPKSRAKNAAEIVRILDPTFAAKPLAHWREVLDEGRVIFGVVQTLEEMAHDPQALANGILAAFDKPPGRATHTVSSPLQVMGYEKVVPTRGPDLGEHGAAILAEAGFSAAEIASLAASGAVQLPKSTPASSK
jgi:formyl-CoA transferase